MSHQIPRDYLEDGLELRNRLFDAINEIGETHQLSIFTSALICAVTETFIYQCDTLPSAIKFKKGLVKCFDECLWMQIGEKFKEEIKNHVES